MKNERILAVGPYAMGREGLKGYIETFGKDDGHKVIALAASLPNAEVHAKDGLKPTAVIVIDFPRPGQTEAVTKGIKSLFPKANIIVWGTDRKIEDADFQVGLLIYGAELSDFLTKLQHKK